MPETKKYIVTHKHAFDFKIGEVVELTARQALALVNKIKLAPVAEKAVEPVVEKPIKQEKKKTKKAGK